MITGVQEGIFWQEKTTPGAHFGILFLRLNDDLDAASAYEGLRSLWTMYQHLKQGRTADLPGIQLPDSHLTVTIGYGRNLFGRVAGIRQAVPQGLKLYGNLKSPAPTGGGEILKGAGLSYSSKTLKNPATEDIVLQFTAATALGVNQAIVETWKFLTFTSPFAAFGKFYTGFQREDHRSWLGFHDGISNLRSGKERQNAIEIKPGIAADSWVERGTYLVFMRIEVDLRVWHRLGLADQELLVGRTKLSGCPVVGIDTATQALRVPTGCPVVGTTQITDPAPAGSNFPFFETPVVADPVVLLSHVQRANHHIAPTSDRNSLRIFRQGYEFLESTNESPGFSAGLNFVSFQDTPERVTRMLTSPSWLGGVNFGGNDTHPTNQNSPLLSVLAGGVYVVPPANDQNLLPGYDLFVVG